ncbi:heparan-alpha-glucosaminide N-acetyltransferase [Flavobacteriaceae bacterium (ex Bugula neritina AB1)]|nr:heparan-alpha-glucosaminide N-acetyltransferase [Flavobacteriaceae bacterium (ex Bugula neritina AB1)]
MILVNTPGDWSHVYSILLHADWNGLTLADFVFPFFLFIVGISISFVYKSKQISSFTLKKIGIRSLRLILLGLFLNAFLPYPPFIEEINTIRLPGVLQRIGVVFFIASILYLTLNKKQLFLVTILILIVYWVWLSYIPLPNGQLPSLERAPNNWANFVDYKLLKGHIWKSDYDPEGILSTLPSIATTLIGICIGTILLSPSKRNQLLLLISGISLLLLGYLWSRLFPINKALWSSSFVLVTSGYATILLYIVHYFMDHKGLKFGSTIKQVGANAIVIYFLSSFIAKSFYLIKADSKTPVHQYLYETFFVSSSINASLSSLLYAVSVTGFYILLAYLLHRKNIFIKV